MKVLNLYAGIGGNRKLWTDCDVTAVELNPDIAKIYQDCFPDDTVVVGDAHQYLLDHYKEYDFIWSSPPCQSNSRVREAGIKADRYSNKPKMVYHDLSLYQEVLLLERFFEGKYLVENVEPFYTPLIPAKKIERHLFWSNFPIQQFQVNNKKRSHETAELPYLAEYFGVKLSALPGNNIEKRQILRNCVLPELGLHIFNQALSRIDNTKAQQINLLEGL